MLLLPMLRHLVWFCKFCVAAGKNHLSEVGHRPLVQCAPGQRQDCRNSVCATRILPMIKQGGPPAFGKTSVQNKCTGHNTKMVSIDFPWWWVSAGVIRWPIVVWGPSMLLCFTLQDTQFLTHQCSRVTQVVHCTTNATFLPHSVAAKFAIPLSC